MMLVLPGCAMAGAEARGASEKPSLSMTLSLSHTPSMHGQGELGDTKSVVGALTLREAIELLIGRNLDLKASRLNVQMAQADVDIAGTSPNPQLSVMRTRSDWLYHNTPPNGWDDSPPSRHSQGMAIQWEHPIERGHKRELRQQSARAALDESRSEDEGVTYGRLRALYEAFFSVLKEDRKLAYAHSHAEGYQAMIGVANVLASHHKATPQDVKRLSLERALADNEIRKAEGALSQARITLAQLLGEPTQASGPLVQGEWVSNLDTPPVDVQALADRQPEVMATKFGLSSAHHATALAQAQRKRDVTLLLSWSRDGHDAPDTVGLGISVPIFTGNDFSAEARRAEIQESASEVTLENQRSEMVAQLASQLDALHVAAKVVRGFRDGILQQAEANMHAVDESYRHGDADVLELIDAHSTLYQVRTDALEAEADYSVQVHAWLLRERSVNACGSYQTDRGEACRPFEVHNSAEDTQ